MTQITLGGVDTPRPIALKSDIAGIYTRMDAVNVTINAVELGTANLADKGGKIQWGNIVGKPIAAIGVTGIVTLSDAITNDKTKAASLKGLSTVIGEGFVPTKRQVNSRTLDRDVVLTEEDLYTLSKTQVDALASEAIPADRSLSWGPAVTTALADVPTGNLITAFISPTSVISRPLQIWNGKYTQVLL